MNWIEVTVCTVPDKLDALCQSLEDAGVSGLVINDEATVNDFLDKNRKYWDYVDDEVFETVKGVCSVQFYLEESEDGRFELERIKSAVPGDYKTDIVNNEDWENNWRQYYKPMETGDKLVIVPEWETVPENGRVPLKLDPGLIFGTGSHPTTKMCLEELEKYPAEKVLDLGCGSGILGIAAVLLGAKKAVGCDIDEKAPRVVMENGALNDIFEDRLSVYSGDVLNDKWLAEKIAGKYGLVLANIVADVIIALAPSVPQWLSDSGVFICSGIIEGRQYEVQNALKSAGFKIIKERHIDDWYCYVSVHMEE